MQSSEPFETSLSGLRTDQKRRSYGQNKLGRQMHGIGEVRVGETWSGVRSGVWGHGHLSSDTRTRKWRASELVLAVSPSVLQLPTCVRARLKALDQENATAA